MPGTGRQEVADTRPVWTVSATAGNMRSSAEGSLGAIGVIHPGDRP